LAPSGSSPDQRRLEREGTAVALTPKAFDLLVALVHHHTRALSKDEILTLVWSGSVVRRATSRSRCSSCGGRWPTPASAWPTVPRHGYRFVAEVIEERETFARRHEPALHRLGRTRVSLREGITSSVAAKTPTCDSPSVPLAPARARGRPWLDATLEISEAATARGEDRCAYGFGRFLVGTEIRLARQRRPTAS
jgi:DNA-binding winged helix-turn-helix (wHTH) protein